MMYDVLHCIFLLLPLSLLIAISLGHGLLNGCISLGVGYLQILAVTPSRVSPLCRQALLHSLLPISYVLERHKHKLVAWIHVTLLMWHIYLYVIIWLTFYVQLQLLLLKYILPLLYIICILELSPSSVLYNIYPSHITSIYTTVHQLQLQL